MAIVGWLVYEYQVLWTQSTYYLLLIFFVPLILISLFVLYGSIKKIKLVITVPVIIVTVLILSFSIWSLSHFGQISILNSQDRVFDENQIIHHILSWHYNDVDVKLAVQPLEEYGWDHKEWLKKEFSKYSSLLDRFFEINNPSKLILQSFSDDEYLIDNNRELKDDLLNLITVQVSFPAYDPESGYVIEYTGKHYTGELNVYKYKLGKLLYIDTLDSWYY